VPKVEYGFLTNPGGFSGMPCVLKSIPAKAEFHCDFEGIPAKAGIRLQIF
jgi:hypothetical protein